MAVTEKKYHIGLGAGDVGVRLSRFFGVMFCHLFGVMLIHLFKEGCENMAATFARQVKTCGKTHDYAAAL